MLMISSWTSEIRKRRRIRRIRRRGRMMKHRPLNLIKGTAMARKRRKRRRKRRIRQMMERLSLLLQMLRVIMIRQPSNRKRNSRIVMILSWTSALEK